jgi:hypothetical protein
VPQQNEEPGYLRHIEVLAKQVAACAEYAGWLSYEPDPGDATQLQEAVNDLARDLRHVHSDGDGCLDAWHT